MGAGHELCAFARAIEKANLPPFTALKRCRSQTRCCSGRCQSTSRAGPASAATSRPWSHGSYPVRFQRLADLGTKTTFTKRHYESYNTELLARVEEEYYERVPAILERIEPNTPYVHASSRSAQDA